MTTINKRIAKIIRSEYDKLPADRHPTEQTLADAIVSQLSLQLSLGGHYVAYGIRDLDDDERDEAGFTYHRKTKP